MSSNTLVAFCVAALFVLAALTVVMSYLERRREHRRDVQAQPIDPGQTQAWPQPPDD